MIVIDEKLCQNCHHCVAACPNHIIFKGPRFHRMAAPFCIKCGHCASACPEKAITVMGYQGAQTLELPESVPVEPDQMMLMLKGRRSVRAYKGRPVAKKHLKAIIEAAAVAPSASNQHTVKAYVYTDAEVIDRIRKQTIAYYAKLLRMLTLPGANIAATRLGPMSPATYDYYKQAFKMLTDPRDKRDKLFRHTRTLLAFTAPAGDEMAAADAYFASHNAVLYAQTIPVGSCYNGFLVAAAGKNARVKAAMKIPKNEKVVTTMTLGYSKLRYHRTAPRKDMETLWF